MESMSSGLSKTSLKAISIQFGVSLTGELGRARDSGEEMTPLRVLALPSQKWKATSDVSVESTGLSHTSSRLMGNR